ncbi:hypothetical protein CSUB01_12220, partial [Colletotrichum sublineola]
MPVLDLANFKSYPSLPKDYITALLYVHASCLPLLQPSAIQISFSVSVHRELLLLTSLIFNERKSDIRSFTSFWAIVSRKRISSFKKFENITQSNNPFAHLEAQQSNFPDEKPPAYTQTPQSSTGYQAAPNHPVESSSTALHNTDFIISADGKSVSTPEDPYAFLSSFDTIFLIDDSGSMAGDSWPEVRNVLRAIIPICTSHDDDGIDLYFLNNKTSNSSNVRAGKAANGYYGIRRAETVQKIFTTVRPCGATPTGQRLGA